MHYTVLTYFELARQMGGKLLVAGDLHEIKGMEGVDV